MVYPWYVSDLYVTGKSDELYVKYLPENVV